MIIELYGLAGVGKSTVARQLEREGWRRVRITRRRELLWYNICFCLQYPSAAFLSLWTILLQGHKPKTLYLIFMNAWLHHNAKYIKARRFKQAVIDQGHWQDTIIIFKRPQPVASIQKYLNWMPRPDLLVVCDLSEDERQRRLTARDQQRKKEERGLGVEMREKAAYANNQILRASLSELLVLSLILSMDAPVEALAARIIAAGSRPDVAYITNVRFPTERAHGYQIAKTCEALTAAGATVELIVPHRRNSVTADPNHYYGLRQPFVLRILVLPDWMAISLLPKRLGFFLNSLWFAMRICLYKRSHTPRIVYTRSPEIVIASWLRGWTVIFEAHSWPQSKERLYRWIVQKATAVVCNSQGTAAEFQQRGFDKVIIAPNGVDLQEFEHLPEKDAARAAVGLPLQTCIAVYTGHLYEWKGIGTVVQAALQAPDVIFVIVGGDEREQQPWRERAGRAANIVWLYHQPRTEMRTYIAAADVLMLPNVAVTRESTTHTSPIKMFEYMASHRPIIASDLPSIREVLNDKNSFLIPADNPHLLIDKIREAYNNTEVAQSRAVQAYQDVQQYSWDARGRILYTFFQSL